MNSPNGNTMQPEGTRATGGWTRWAVIGIALLVAYPLSIGPVYRIVHPTGRPANWHRQRWPDVVPVVYQPLGFLCAKSWTAESTVCRYLSFWGEDPACGTYPK
jgi:hypothetical protein